MTKLNNRGFAISTILYGLLVVLILITTLIMSTMAFTRKNSKEFTENIARDLENDRKVAYSESNICSKEAKAYTYKYSEANIEVACDEIIDHLKQQYFATCYRKNQNETTCNTSLEEKLSEITTISTECLNKNTSIEITAKKSCCYYRNSGYSNNYNACMS